MFTTAITLAVIGIAISTLTDLAKHDGAKIVDALLGRSWVAAPRPERLIVVRFGSRMAETPEWQPDLRAAA